MSEREEHPILIAVATTIADGMPVDWESLIQEYPDIAMYLDELRVLQGVEAARRQAEEERRRRKR